MNLRDWGQQIKAVIASDPRSHLAYTITQLDPFAIWGDADEDNTYEDDLTFAEGLQYLRPCPIYAEAIILLHQGKSESEVEQAIKALLNKQGFALDEWWYIPYGIPFPFYGANLEEMEETPSAAVDQLLRAFGAKRFAHGYDMPSSAYEKARRMSQSLAEREEENWKAINCLIQWLFSLSGNTLVDMTAEEAGEINPLGWDEYDYGLAIAQEALEFMEDVSSGIQLIEDEAIFAVLKTAIRKGNYVWDSL